MGIGTSLFGFAQILLRGVLANVKMRTFYNPGMATAIVLHGAIGAWFFIEASSEGVLSGSNWLFGVLYMVGFAAIFMGALGYGFLADKNSPYPFAPEELERFDRKGHLAQIARKAPSGSA